MNSKNNPSSERSNGFGVPKGILSTLRSKILFAFSILFFTVLVTLKLVEIFGIPFVIEGEYQHHRSEVFANLNLIADLKKVRLQQWLEKRKEDVNILIESDLIQNPIYDIVKSFDEYHETIGQGINPWVEIQNRQSYRDLVQYFNTVKGNNKKYEDIQLADFNTGTIIVSTNSKDLGQSCYLRCHVDIQADDLTASPLFTDEHCISFVKDEHFGNSEVLFSKSITLNSGSPPNRKNLPIVLVTHINIDKLIVPMLHTGTGLGESGEVLLVDSDVKILTRLKHPLPDGSAAEPFKFRINAEPAVLASQGNEGNVESTDYRGVRVLAAYRYIPISSVDGWGLIVKQDWNEIFEDLKRSIATTSLIGILGFILGIVFTYIISGNLSRPIHHLSQCAQKVKEGDLSVSLPVTTSDEVGTLTATFNSMVQRLHEWYTQLEDEVKDRTHELSLINEQLEYDIAERERLKQLQSILIDIANARNMAEDLDTLYRSIEKLLSKVCDTTNFYIALYDRQSNVLSFPYYIDEKDTHPEPKLLGKGLTEYVLISGQSLLLDKKGIFDYADRGDIELIGTPSEQWLGVPLNIKDQTVGVIVVQNYSNPTSYSEKEVELFEFVSGQIADGIIHQQNEDIIKQSEQRHRRLSQELLESNNMKDLLLDIITHDLKNPAGVISGMGEILVAENPKDEALQLIKTSSDDLLKVISNATTLSRMIIGDEIEMMDINLHTLLNEIIKGFSASLEENGMRVENLVAEGQNFKANPIIEEVFKNYISNAIKYTKSGKKIVIESKMEGKALNIMVKDFGKTISEQDREAVFARGVQIDKGAKKGRGLGLAIVKRIARVHNAEAGVTPNTPTGNIFYLKIAQN